MTIRARLFIGQRYYGIYNLTPAFAEAFLAKGYTLRVLDLG